MTTEEHVCNPVLHPSSAVPPPHPSPLVPHLLTLHTRVALSRQLYHAVWFDGCRADGRVHLGWEERSKGGDREADSKHLWLSMRITGRDLGGGGGGEGRGGEEAGKHRVTNNI